MSLYVCPLCFSSRQFKTFLQFFRHITLFHQNEYKFQITCNLSLSCGTSYNTYAGYKSHIYRHHFDELRVSHNKIDVFESSDVNNILPFDPNNDNDAHYSSDDTGDSDTTNEDEDDIGSSNLFDSLSDQTADPISILDIKKSFALFMLQLREQFLLPKNIINSISTYVVTFVNHLQSLFEQKIMRNDVNDKENISSSKSTSTLIKTYLDIDTIKNTINEICYAVEAVTRNEYQFQLFCEEHFSYRPPKEIIISNPGEPTQVAYFIPIDETIKSILRNEYVIKESLDNMKQQREKGFTDEDLMFSFRDGHFGSRIDDDSLLIQLYVDDIGLTNPIGAKKDRHKMSMIYFCLEDLSDEHRSQLEHIHLVGICTSGTLKDDIKAKRFFEPIIGNLNHLQQHGLVINGRSIKFSFSTFVTDNLAAHQIGGFQSWFSNGYICRRCFIQHCDLHLPMSQTKPEIRTSIQHDRLILQLNSNLNKTSIMGVVGESPIYGLDGFHPIMSLPADLMHDYLEGVCPRVIMSLLKEASAMRLITYQNEVDGETLEMMDNVDKVAKVIPKLKYQLLFLKEREKLFKQSDNRSLSKNDSPSVISKDLNSSFSSPSSDDITMNTLSNQDIHDQTLDETTVKENIDSKFPAEYTIPQLPQSLLQDIEAGALHKFGPHHANRQVLIDTITYDLLKTYHLFYPNHKQFDAIGSAIVRLLTLPFTKDNLAIWKEAVQIKLKRKRCEHKENMEVQYHLMKYSRTGSGRPVKKMIGEVASRDRQKQILTMNYNEDVFESMKMKSQELRNNIQIDRDTQILLWKETLHIRRKSIRDLSTSAILEEFPGYKDSLLIFEEVRLTMEVDLRTVVRYQVPILLEKLLSSPAFITDSPPIQLIRVLCRHFGETVHHIYSDTTPSTPYPTLVLMNDVIHIFVDFIPIVSTTSPDDGLGLLLAMYAVFELNFNRNSRTIRLLYAIVFGDKRFISNSTRNLIKEKNIDICFEQNRKMSNSTNAATSNSTTTTTTQHVSPQSMAQDQCTSSSLSSPTNMMVNDSSVDNGSVVINTDSYDNSSKVVEQSSSSSNVVVNRKRTRKALSQISKDKENCILSDDNHDDELDDQKDINCSVNSKLSSAVRQTRAKKRRY